LVFSKVKKDLDKVTLFHLIFFFIAMEVLSLMLEEIAKGSSGFSFHPKCSAINLTHLCFADDLLIFFAAKLTSVKAIKEVLLEFEDLYGLKANPAKSVFFCAGIEDDDKKELLDLLQMQEGTLPVRYLGVPLVTKSLSAADCASLVSRITARMNSWLVRHISFAGRLQLLNSVLFSLQSYWTRVFILPQKVIKLLEQKFNRFLWNGKDAKARAKVAWDRVCVPKQEGGLGISVIRLLC
jgi:hypothetical protein